jgi:hypothetical protein
VRRPDAAVAGTAALFVVYLLTLAPDVTFWDAGEFISAAYTLGIPHPPGTPLYVLLASVWAKLFFFLPFAAAMNLLSAAATAAAAGLSGALVTRWSDRWPTRFAATIVAGAMSTAWLSATESEVYAAALLLAVLMICCADRAGRAQTQSDARRWLLLTVYLMAVAVPLHLSALVAAPVAVVLATLSGDTLRWERGVLLGGAFVAAMGVGKMSPWLVGIGAIAMVAATLRARWWSGALTTLVLAALGVSAIAFMYVRASLDPAVNQGDPGTWTGLADMVARRQYAVAPMWPRKAALWVQLGNLFQYADWQIALSFGPTVLPAIGRSLFTALFLMFGWIGAQEHYRHDRRTFFALAALLACGAIGVLVYLNLNAGPSIGFGVLAANTPREARERDYFYVFAFWTWGLWAGIGAIVAARGMKRPLWVGGVIACLPIVLNWRAVTRNAQPEARLPLLLAEALLESTPRNGVLFVVGDNDSYPLWYAQVVHRIRQDVAVITVPLLPTEWYRRQLSARHGRLDPSEVSIWRGTSKTAIRVAEMARTRGRPVVAAMTVSPRPRTDLGARWRAAGVVFVAADSGAGPAMSIDTVTSNRIASLVTSRVGSATPRPAIDPVNSFFRRMLDCPRQLVAAARAPSDSTQLDSVCNYR